MPSSNPRYANSSRRARIRRWLIATQDHCALCGKPIDKTLKTPHPMSAEVDEIIPISKGGSPTDRDNVQLTHRVCNQRKSNKVTTPYKISNLPLPISRDW
jgi:5-methylcytosine-specific restriction endonuclease McrA